MDWMIVGLGNPGVKYLDTRHNIGWMAAAKFVEKHKREFTLINNIGYKSEFSLKGNKVLVVMPTTYMNDSGRAVKYFADKYKIPAERIIVIVDEYNFPVGKIHVRQSGGPGGHNGTESVILELNADNFFRIRCGIGKDFPPGGMVDYVLQAFPESDMPELQKSLDKTGDAIEALIGMDKTKAMSFVNSGKLWEPPKAKPHSWASLRPRPDEPQPPESDSPDRASQPQ